MVQKRISHLAGKTAYAKALWLDMDSEGGSCLRDVAGETSRSPMIQGLVGHIKGMVLNSAGFFSRRWQKRICR